MPDTVIIALISFFGTVIGTFSGILTANKLVNYRLTQIERKLEQSTSLYDIIASELNKLKTSYEVFSVKLRNVESRLEHVERIMEDIEHEN